MQPCQPRGPWMLHDAPWLLHCFPMFPWSSMIFHDLPWFSNVFPCCSMVFPWVVRFSDATAFFHGSNEIWNMSQYVFQNNENELMISYKYQSTHRYAFVIAFWQWCFKFTQSNTFISYPIPEGSLKHVCSSLYGCWVGARYKDLTRGGGARKKKSFET